MTKELAKLSLECSSILFVAEDNPAGSNLASKALRAYDWAALWETSLKYF